MLLNRPPGLVHEPPPRRAVLQRARPAHICRANYRWSADDAGGRKRESLYSYDENREPRGGATDGDGGSSASGSAGAGGGQNVWPEEWQQWLDVEGDRDQQQQQPQILAEQQAAWEAGNAASGSSQRRARPVAAAHIGRLSRRRQRAIEQAAAAAQGDVAAAADQADPWLQTELRQMRRRQAAAAPAKGGTARPDRAAAAGARGQEGQASLPDPLAQDWGPLEGAPEAAAKAAEDWGWAAESWAAATGSSRGSRQQQRERRKAERDAAGSAGPGSSWELAQQQRGLRRQRRRSSSSAAWGGGSGIEQVPASAAGSADADQAAQVAAGYPNDEGSGAAQQQYARDREGQYDVDWDANWQGQEQYDEERYSGAGQYGEDGGQYSDEYEPGATAQPDIALLSSEELDRVLPVVPFAQQAAFYSGSATDGVQRWGASLAATVVLSKVAVLAATSLTWPLWWPWALAAKKNLALRRQYSYGGLWRTQVLAVSISGRPRPFTTLDDGGLGGLGGVGVDRGSTMRMASILVGDPGGAQTQMVLPYDSRYELMQGGEAAELLVLSSDPSFQRFKAVKDVYLPGSGLWVSEYPHADRTQFLEVSLQIEREAQADAEEAQYGGDTASNAAGQVGSNGGRWQQGGYGAARY